MKTTVLKCAACGSVLPVDDGAQKSVKCKACGSSNIISDDGIDVTLQVTEEASKPVIEYSEAEIQLFKKMNNWNAGFSLAYMAIMLVCTIASISTWTTMNWELLGVSLVYIVVYFWTNVHGQYSKSYFGTLLWAMMASLWFVFNLSAEYGYLSNFIYAVLTLLGAGTALCLAFFLGAILNPTVKTK